MPSPARPWRILAQGPGLRRFSHSETEIDFDELVFGGFFHLERMSRRCWSLIVDGPGMERVSLAVVARRDGNGADVFVVEGKVFRSGARRRLGKARRG